MFLRDKGWAQVVKKGGKDSSKMHTDGRINLEPGGQDNHKCSLMASGIDWDDRLTAKAVFERLVR
jgi:hypothetical protein